ncbi:eyes absent homolog [Caerostris extrusa]|uniref:Eyes absent homolog n=1 Tax=Caerostris extrusa TaxID=172846 RepID=A0AAV4RSM7_CAEEX|nr:eyes absent homolog [Caerostris extrusa]
MGKCGNEAPVKVEHLSAPDASHLDSGYPTTDSLANYTGEIFRLKIQVKEHQPRISQVPIQHPTTADVNLKFNNQLCHILFIFSSMQAYQQFGAQTLHIRCKRHRTYNQASQATAYNVLSQSYGVTGGRGLSHQNSKTNNSSLTQSAYLNPYSTHFPAEMDTVSSKPVHIW